MTATRRLSPTTRPSRSTSSRVSRLTDGAEPNSNLPGTTMMMLEPSPSTWSSTSCLAPLPRATRTTTAATPITTPSMVSALRSRLARSASSATRNASPPSSTPAPPVRSSSPSRTWMRRRAMRRDLEVVGDDDDRDAPLDDERLEDGHDLGPAAGVEVAGGLVGQQQASAPRPARGRSRPAAARRRRAGPAGAPAGGRARRRPARRRRARAARPGARRGRPAAGRRCPARWCGRAAGRTGTRSRSCGCAARRAHRRTASRRRGRRPAATPEVGRSRQPSRCIRVDLPEPDGPTTATYSPGSMRRLTPRSASTDTPSSW